MTRPPLRIAYLGQMADVSGENGISKKIAAQSARWREAGHSVRYFSLVPTTAAWPGLAPLEVDLIARGSVLHRGFRSLQLVQRIEAWRPDVIYFRYAYHSAGFPGLFRRLPTVAEINSDDVTEYRISLSRTKYLYHRLTRTRILAPVAGFVPVTREIANRLSRFGKPTEVIANGIDLDAHALAPLPPPGPLRLVFLGGAGSPWHGLERVAELAEMFPQVEFEIIGYHATGAAAPPNVRFHGPLSRERYQPLLGAATAAIGSMALYKNRMEEACPLKVREYLALGLPIIAAYQDTDIPDDADYFLRLPNDPRPLQPERARIAAWLEQWRNRRVPRAAVAQIGSDLKEQRRLAFLTRIVRGENP